MLNVYFWNKNEKMFQTDLEKDFKKTWQQVLVYTSWTGNARILNMPESAEKCFFRSRENQILEFYIFKFHDVIKCLNIKQQIHFTELPRK